MYLRILLHDLQKVASRTSGDYFTRILMQAQRQDEQGKRERHAARVFFLVTLHGTEQDQATKGGVEQVPYLERALVPAFHLDTPQYLTQAVKEMGMPMDLGFRCGIGQDVEGTACDIGFGHAWPDAQ